MLLRRFAVLAMVLIPCLLSAGGVNADAVTEARKAVQSIYDKRNAAVAAKDLKGILSNCTPDFVYIAKDGQKGGLSVLKKRLLPLLSLAQKPKVTTTRQKFTLKGKEVTTVVKTHIESLFFSPTSQTPSKMVVDDTSEDVWIQSEKGWLQKRKKSLSDVMTIDGKPVQLNLDLKDPGKTK
jgi:hypothetical protein